MGELQLDRSDDRSIPNLDTTPLEVVFSPDDDSVLAHAARRVIDEVQGKREQYAAHSSSA
jgi:hypothetical protein